MDKKEQKAEKKQWIEPKLIDVEKVKATAECASGGADSAGCSTGGGTFQCASGNSAVWA